VWSAGGHGVLGSCSCGCFSEGCGVELGQVSRIHDSVLQSLTAITLTVCKTIACYTKSSWQPIDSLQSGEGW